MTSLSDKFSPHVTTLIRLDHSHVRALFGQYKPERPAEVRRGLVQAACLALEIHAQLEEDIFYPALRGLSQSEALKRAPAEHAEARRLTGLLREMEPTDARYDETVMELMRCVMHHVADEETMLLPEAERLMPERLAELGRAMARRRLQLSAPRAGEMAMHLARTLPGSAVAVTLGFLAAGLWLGVRIARA